MSECDKEVCPIMKNEHLEDCDIEKCPFKSWDKNPDRETASVLLAKLLGMTEEQRIEAVEYVKKQREKEDDL
jgi:hypothetical protein